MSVLGIVMILCFAIMWGALSAESDSGIPEGFFKAVFYLLLIAAVGFVIFLALHWPHQQLTP